jgi:formylglycine-generating enzyme required for sulfatase activity
MPVRPFEGVVAALLPAPRVPVGKDWFENGEGQTYAVIRDPGEFTRGSPRTEPRRYDDEAAHRKRIKRTFAIATKEVTVEQYLRFRPNHPWTKSVSPGPDTPAVSATWYDCAAYCNWLCAREGIPPDQWCYEPNAEGEYAPGMRMKPGHLALTGYRLPTESEWEYACRAGAVTARYFGRGEELLPRYGRFLRNSDMRAWPVGQLRPNELGLFDVLGNAAEWVEDPAFQESTGEIEDTENRAYLVIDERSSRIVRGGSYYDHPGDLRSANRNNDRPGRRTTAASFRPARTLSH